MEPGSLGFCRMNPTKMSGPISAFTTSGRDALFSASYGFAHLCSPMLLIVL
ncbi:MAG: hypothetical protein ACOC87_00010 [Candidatus Natronoplasma sp.]